MIYLRYVLLFALLFARSSSQAIADEHGKEGHSDSTVIPHSVAERSGIQSEVVGPHLIKRVLETRGKILPSEHRIAHIIPRFSGVVKEGRKHIGDPVAKNEVLAIIESNQSLQPFEVRSQIEGTVVNGHLIVGEYVPENQWVYIVADISEVWADFFIPLRERTSVKVGQQVEVRTVDNETVHKGSVSYVAPYADEKSQSLLARVVIPNDHRTFLPGMYVTGEIVLDESNVNLAIKSSAIQTFEGGKVVFVRSGDTFTARPVVLGKGDSQWSEVESGLTAGEEYVSANPFLIKADILKAGAAHEH